jgi:threonine dehydrogenase-like Zn-dependent dehydrogenase
MIDRAMRDAPPRSRILVVGVCMETDSVWPMVGISKELNIQFALGYTPEEFAGTLAAIARWDRRRAPDHGRSRHRWRAGSLPHPRLPDAHAKILVEPALD